MLARARPPFSILSHETAPAACAHARPPPSQGRPPPKDAPLPRTPPSQGRPPPKDAHLPHEAKQTPLAAPRDMVSGVSQEGWLDERGMERLLRNADVFVLPSRGEAWGRNLVDAMALGTPVIGCPGSGGPADFLSEERAWPLASWPTAVQWSPLAALAALASEQPSPGSARAAFDAPPVGHQTADQGASSEPQPMWCEPDEVS